MTITITKWKRNLIAYLQSGAATKEHWDVVAESLLTADETYGLDDELGETVEAFVPPTPTPITAEGLRVAGVVPIFAGGQERWAFGGNSNCWLTWSLNGGWRFYFGGHYIRRVKSIEDALGMVAAIRGPGE